MSSWLIVAIAVLVGLTAAATPEVVAHRGASGYLPQHTLPAYALAYGQGAHWIEPDVVLARDGVPIALHDLTLDRTTNVMDVYPERARADGLYYAADFSVAEIQSLRVVERMPRRFPQGLTAFRIPTLDEVLELVSGLNASTGCRVGVYPELKHTASQPAIVGRVLATLERYDVPALLQSFDADALRGLDTEIPLIQLLPRDATPDAGGLEAIARYAAGIGAAKELLYADPGIVRLAHARGLVVHAFTLRADWLADGFTSFDAEVRHLADLGVDAIFTDHPDRAVAVLGLTPGCPRGR